MFEKRRLGQTDLMVTSLCLGSMTWGEQNTEAQGHEQLDYAFAEGVNFIDTAELYSIPPRAETHGSTETIIGNWLASRKVRDRVVLATKVVGPSQQDYFRPDGQRPRLDARNIRYAVEGSLRRLRTDYIDLYQLHWPDRAISAFGEEGTTFKTVAQPDHSVPLEETLAVMEELTREGKIRHFGVSNETCWGVSRFIYLSAQGAGPRVASIQNAYNLLNRTAEIGLAEMCQREQVSFLAYSPLGQGYLTGKYQNGARPAGARTTLFNRGQRYEKPGVEEAVDAYIALAAESGMEPAELALAFVASRPFVTSTIIGATTMEQLRQDMGAFRYKVTQEMEDCINKVHQLYNNPCP